MTPQEKWNRLTNPKTVEDYGLSMKASEMVQVPEAAAELARYGILIDDSATAPTLPPAAEDPK